MHQKEFQVMENTENSRIFWSKMRIKYNVGLVISGILAFFLYVVFGIFLIMPYEEDFEITLFTIAFQAVGYFIMVLIVNGFYTLGYFTDINFNKENSEKFRLNLFKIGFWFSVSLPFIIPINIFMIYFVKYFKI